MAAAVPEKTAALVAVQVGEANKCGCGSYDGDRTGAVTMSNYNCRVHAAGPNGCVVATDKTIRRCGGFDRSPDSVGEKRFSSLRHSF